MGWAAALPLIFSFSIVYLHVRMCKGEMTVCFMHPRAVTVHHGQHPLFHSYGETAFKFLPVLGLYHDSDI